jgi:hypothetical protein
VPIRNKPDFEDWQIAEMQRLGLFDEEIDELRRCLDRLRASLMPAQPIAPVRKLLGALREALDGAERALKPIANPYWERELDGEPFRRLSDTEKLRQLARACVLSSADSDPDSLDRAPALIASLALSVESALQRLPKQQRKRVCISEIRTIHLAWQRGFQSRVWTLDGGLRYGTQPPFRGVVARGDSALFPQVAQFCFDAVGSLASVDGAIRAYLAWDKQRTREGRRRAGFAPEDIDSVGRRGRPRGSTRKRK